LWSRHAPEIPHLPRTGKRFGRLSVTTPKKRASRIAAGGPQPSRRKGGDVNARTKPHEKRVLSARKKPVAEPERGRNGADLNRMERGSNPTLAKVPERPQRKEYFNTTAATKGEAICLRDASIGEKRSS